MAGRLNPPAPRTAARRLAWLAVVLGVLVLHGLATRELGALRARWAEAEKAPQRLEVAFVRELKPAAPPPAPAPRKPKPPPRPVAATAPQPAQAASAPEPVPVEPEPPAPVAQAEPAPVPEPPEPAASEPEAPPFEWPPSTRLTYKLAGNYRGEIHGGARVQWIRIGQRYQVHLDVWLGPPFAPIIERRMTSDGELSEHGLRPLRYDEETKIVFRAARRNSLQFEGDRVRLANGSLREAAPGVQDMTSQFVQLAWLFTTEPQLLHVGNRIVVTLALPRRVEPWVYEVVGQERLRTPVGELDTFHLKPNRPAKPTGDLVAEMWFAPALQYLPVRIRIEQDPETWVDMLLETAPTQAER